MSDLSSILVSAGPYLGITTAVIVPLILWGKSVSEKLNTIEKNHLSHIEASTAETNEHLIEIKTILRERG